MTASLERRLRRAPFPSRPASSNRIPCGSITWTRARATPRRCCWCTATRPGPTSGATSCAELPARGHRCVALDHMGFGRSDKPPHLSSYSLRAHIDNTLALIDQLDLRDVILVAHDWGGPIGLGALLERVDRLRGLVLMNTWAWELPELRAAVPARVPHRGARRDPGAGRKPVRGVDPRRHGEARHRPGDDGRLPGALPGLLVARGPARVSAGDTHHRARPQRAPDLLHPRPAARASTCPRCSIWGMRDRVFQPMFLDQWQVLFPAARPWSSRRRALLVEDRPDEVAAAIDEFVSGL